ncbi:histone-lysine N-methyltransferase 2B-like [Helianthus annuus]|uniref:histone-lysine N-methyltransferase 2B-like n=1 Tax=Helianthus annuus TaxID=4232 RepID=UPI000B9045DB|nr:histone-lysine N-methyltransferase 2B-like [Helianthus annuus]
MKEKSYADELKILKEFKGTRNDWFVKEQKKRGRKATLKAQIEEGSSSQPKKRQKKAAKTLLVDEPVVEAEVEAEAEAEKEKAADDEEGDDVNKSTTSLSSSSEDEIDETERYKKVMFVVEKEKQKKRKRKDKDDDDVYIPSQENKVGARKRVVTPKLKKPLKIVLKKKPTQKPSKPPSPPPEPTPHQSPLHQSPQPSPPKSPHQSPPRQPSPIQSPPHLSPPHIHTATPPQEQYLLTSQQIFQTPPTSQPQIQSTPSSSGFKHFPNIPTNLSIGLDDIGDFDFANNAQVKNVEKKVDDVLFENKRLADREKILEMRVKKLESENKSLLKKIDADQTEIDILKVKVAELEEEKARRDEHNKYFELKNKELEAAKV